MIQGDQIESMFKHTPQHEYYLQGSIFDTSRDILLHRLQGLCDMNLHGGAPQEMFHDHEMVYVCKAPGATVPVQVHARRSLDHPAAPFQLRYIGLPETTGDQCPTMLRTSIDVSTGHNLTHFLSDMGFQMDYEFLAKGCVFHKGSLKVLVYKVFRLSHPGNLEQCEPLTKSHMVELNVVTRPGHTAAAQEVKQFADMLKPLVTLDKLDYRKLLQN